MIVSRRPTQLWRNVSDANEIMPRQLGRAPRDYHYVMIFINSIRKLYYFPVNYYSQSELAISHKEN